MSKPYTLDQCAQLLRRWTGSPRRVRPRDALSALSTALGPMQRAARRVRMRLPASDRSRRRSTQHGDRAQESARRRAIRSLFQARRICSSRLSAKAIDAARGGACRETISARRARRLPQTRRPAPPMSERCASRGTSAIWRELCRARPVRAERLYETIRAAHPALDRRADAAAIAGERMSATPPGKPVAIIADDEDLGRLLLAETAASSGLAPLSLRQRHGGARGGPVAGSRHRAAGRRYAGDGRLHRVPAAARRCALRHGARSSW